MALVCPQCATPMREVKAPAKIGYLLVLDQCPQCGGIWCDRWEVFPLVAPAVENLDHVDEETLRTPVALPAEPLRCPRCRARMAAFHDAALPTDACITRCLNCEGMWFNRGELRRFKRHAAPSAPQATLSPAEIERLGGAVGDPNAWSTVGNLDAAMAAAPPPDSSEEVRAQLMSGAAWMIARAALGLLLHL